MQKFAILTTLLVLLALPPAARAQDRAPDGCDESPLWVLGGSRDGKDFAMAWASWSSWREGAGYHFQAPGDSAVYVLSFRFQSPDAIESLTRQQGRAEVVERYTLRRTHGGCLYVAELEPGLYLILGMADPLYETEIMANVQRARATLNPSKWY